jgi:hypothetical protein
MILTDKVLMKDSLAGVAKWLRQWVVVPPFAGSSPVTRPCFNFLRLSINKKIIYKFN